MYVVAEGNKAIIRMANLTYDDNKTYRKFTYLIEQRCDEGLLIYNLFTGEILLLNEEEALCLENSCINNRHVKTLVNHFLLVREEQNDYMVVENSRKILRAISGNKRNIKRYVILPTSACNARCFYCFEEGIEYKTMSSQTAEQVVTFVLENSVKGGKIHIEWFGGEPLIGKACISRISEGLKNNNVVFSSSMISNGYLFDEKLVEVAKNNWNLEMVQITLDGTQDIYNKTKAYVNASDNPFETVINNIESLLKANIKVCVRINMGDHNCHVIDELSVYLTNKFSKYSGFSAYVTRIFSNECNIAEIKEDDELEILERSINEHFQKYNCYHRGEGKLSGLKCNACMADSDSTILIAPDGKLGKCECYTDHDLVGDLYSGISDKESSLWNERFICDKAEECPLLPACYMITRCPTKQICSDNKVKYVRNLLAKRTLRVYNEFK